MKSIINFSLNNKFAVWILTIIITFGGIYAGLNMKQEMMPNINVPYLSLTVIYPGASPEGVAESVTIPLEKRLKNLPKIKNLNSTSMENVASFFIEYDYGTDLDRASDEIKEALEKVTLPEGVQKPQVSKFSISSFPVVSISVAGEEDLDELTKIVESEVTPSLERIDGVASVQIAGQFVKEVQLKFDHDKMNELGLSEDTVKGMIQASALKVPLGIYELDKADKAVVIDGNITTLEDLMNVAIPVMPQSPTGDMQQGMPQGMASNQGPTDANMSPSGAEGTTDMLPNTPPVMTGLPTIKLSDIATAEVIGKAESISRTNGKPSIGIQVVKANDANTVEVVNAVKAKATEYEAKYSGMEVVVLMDQGKPIEDAVATMLNKALFGGLFAIIVILAFLRNIRSTLISVISIPLSLLIGILILNQLDISLNIMTIGAMTVAIGRVVDDSIVVIENIYRRLALRNEPLKGKELIREATREMFVPIMSSTIVTIAVFLPIALVSGMIGEMFMPFALTIVFALLASLLVAITIVPMLAHTMFRNGIKEHKLREKHGKLASSYQKMLNWSLNHKLITFGLAVLLLIGSFALVPVIGVSFLPDQEDKFMLVTYSPAPGDRIEDVEARALIAEKYILERPGVEKMQYSVGGANPMSPGPSKSGLFYIQYRSDTPNFEDEKKALIDGLRDQVTTGKWSEMDMMGGFGGSKLSLHVFGESLEQITPIIDRIVDLAKADPSFEKVDTSLSTTYEQYTIVADQQKLSSLGLTAGQIAMKLAPIHTRPTLTEVTVDGKHYTVYIETDKKEYSNIEEIKNETITSPLGMPVAIKDVADIQVGQTQNSIARLNGRLMVEVSANITIADVNKASSELQKKVEELQLPRGVEVSFAGVTEQINETFTQLGLAMAAAVAIVYFILVVTFGGALAPFAILFSLPFAIIGGLLALLIAGETLSVSAMMGALMLIGIVVTNAIVLIDRVIRKEHEGLSTREALLEAGGTRLRPILMTALATIGALLPLAFGYESAGVMSKGLGVTVIGGLASSTLLTLIIVPIVYEFLMGIGKKKRSKRVKAETV